LKFLKETSLLLTSFSSRGVLSSFKLIAFTFKKGFCIALSSFIDNMALCSARIASSPASSGIIL